MATYIKAGANQVDFNTKPVWKDRWRYGLDHIGSDIGVLGEGVVSQRFVLPGNAGKSMTLYCPLVTATQLAILILMANYNAGPLEVKHSGGFSSRTSFCPGLVAALCSHLWKTIRRHCELRRTWW